LRDTLLTPLGFAILEAEDGKQAVEMAQHAHPDLIFMDLLMPNMDGFEATRRIRELETRKIGNETDDSQVPVSDFQFPIPIIGISASVSEQVRQDCRDAGCDGFLPKPWKFAELVECLQRHLDIKWVYEEPSDVGREKQQDANGSSRKIPSRSVLDELWELAQGGRISEIQHMMTEIRDADPGFKRFTDTITGLAEEFQMEQIVEYLQTLNNNRK
jgi:CheY-like chemotaxis protein